jgi:hypothetical protein
MEIRNVIQIIQILSKVPNYPNFIQILSKFPNYPNFIQIIQILSKFPNYPNFIQIGFIQIKKNPSERGGHFWEPPIENSFFRRLT